MKLTMYKEKQMVQMVPVLVYWVILASSGWY